MVPRIRAGRAARARRALGVRPSRRARPSSCWPSPRPSSRRSTCSRRRSRQCAAPVEAVRDPGRRPSAGEDPLNAIVRFCRVRAEEPRGSSRASGSPSRTRSRSPASRSPAARASSRASSRRGQRRRRPHPARRRRGRGDHEHGRPRLLRRRRVELVRADAEPVGRDRRRAARRAARRRRSSTTASTSRSAATRAARSASPPPGAAWSG